MYSVTCRIKSITEHVNVVYGRSTTYYIVVCSTNHAIVERILTFANEKPYYLVQKHARKIVTINMFASNYAYNRVKEKHRNCEMICNIDLCNAIGVFRFRKDNQS